MNIALQFYFISTMETYDNLRKDRIPNETTLKSFAEGEKMLAEGTGQRYTNTKDLFAELED